MHKPLRIIKDDARVRLTQQVNLTSAARTALLTLPETFDERQLFERIAQLSYGGDLRMALPFENRNKVSNIVDTQTPQFKELYYRLIVGLPGIQWAQDSTSVTQDLSPQTRAAHVRKLPSELRKRIDARFTGKTGVPSKESDESAFWSHVAADPSLPKTIEQGQQSFFPPVHRSLLTGFLEVNSIVRHSSTIQTAKGLATAGVGSSLLYAGRKLAKYWRGGQGGQ